MLVGRIIKLALVALVTIGLSVGVSVGDTQPFAGTDQTTLSAPPTSGDCRQRDCATPCVASIMDRLHLAGLASTQRVALQLLSAGSPLIRLAASAELRPPAPLLAHPHRLPALRRCVDRRPPKGEGGLSSAATDGQQSTFKEWNEMLPAIALTSVLRQRR
jgi:hypothetical protein